MKLLPTLRKYAGQGDVSYIQVDGLPPFRRFGTFGRVNKKKSIFFLKSIDVNYVLFNNYLVY